MIDLNTFTPPPNPGDTLKRVLVIKLGAMGDFMQRDRKQDGNGANRNASE